jgi:hypothetical protein
VGGGLQVLLTGSRDMEGEVGFVSLPSTERGSRVWRVQSMRPDAIFWYEVEGLVRHIFVNGSLEFWDRDQGERARFWFNSYNWPKPWFQVFHGLSSLFSFSTQMAYLGLVLGFQHFPFLKISFVLNMIL